MSRYFFGNKRRLLAFVILIGGIVLASIILYSGNSGEGGSLISFLGGSGGVPSNLNFKLGAPGNVTAASGGTASSSDNLTEQVVKAYGAQILALNARGMKKTNADAPITVPSDQLLSDLISQGLTQGIPVPTFGKNDIRILKTDSTEVALTYLKALVTSYERDFKKASGNFFSAVSDAVQNEKPDALLTHTNAISGFLADLLQVPVPPSWENFHLQMLNLWQRRLTLANTILGNADDPLKTIVAVQQLSDGVDAEQAMLDRVRTALP